MHKNIAEIIAEAAQKVIGNPPKCSKKWISDVILTLVAKRDNAKQRYHQRKSAATKERWKDLASKFKHPILRMRDASWKGKLLNLNRLIN